MANVGYVGKTGGRLARIVCLRTDSVEFGAELFVGLVGLARILNLKGNNDEASKQCLEGLRILTLVEEINGEIHPCKPGVLDNLGLILKDKKRYDEAESVQREALKIRTELLVLEHPELAVSLNNLASVLEEQGKYDEAEKLFLEALDCKENRLPEEHPSVVRALINLARFYADRQRHDEASYYCLRASTVCESVSREKRLNIATSLFNLAKFHYEPQERYSEAEPFYEQALKIIQRELGDNHDDVATCFNNLASIYQHLDRYEDAKGYYIKAFEIWQQLGDQFKYKVAITLNNLAGLYGKLAELHEEVELYADAETHYNDALQMLIAQLGRSHDLTQQVWGNFQAFLREVIERGQTAYLSKNPATQRLVQNLQEPSQEERD